MADGSTLPFSPPRAVRPPAPEPLERLPGPLALLRRLRRNPLECFTRRHFNDLIVAGGLPFKRVVLVSHPQAVRRVLLDNAGAYRKDFLQRRVLSGGLADGLLGVDGPRWKAQRRVAAPIFALRQVHGFAPAMRAAALDVVRRWPVGDGARIALDVEMRRITLEVLERTIFTDGFGSDAETIREAMAVYFDGLGRLGPLDLLGAPKAFPRPGRRKIAAALRLFEAGIDRLIADRRALLLWRPRTAPADMLTALLSADGLSEAEIRSNLITLFSAGHETTANTLTWTLALLALAPDWRARVEREADAAPDDALVLPVARAVIEEALRLYPPIAALSREALAADELAGVKIAKGTLVVIAPYVIHRHRQLWERPQVFDPARFLGEARAAVDRFSYLPFGAGPRTCLGGEFALQEATLALTAIVRRYRLDLAPGESLWPRLNVTLRPQGGVRMILQSRTRIAPPATVRAAAG